MTRRMTGHEELTETEVQAARLVANQPRNRPDIADRLGLRSRSGHLYKAIDHLRNLGFLELTVPDKPQSRNPRCVSRKRSGLARPAVPVRGRNHASGASSVSRRRCMSSDGSSRSRLPLPGLRLGICRVKPGVRDEEEPDIPLGGWAGDVSESTARHVHGPMEPRDALQHPPCLQEAVASRG